MEIWWYRYGKTILFDFRWKNHYWSVHPFTSVKEVTNNSKDNHIYNISYPIRK